MSAAPFRNAMWRRRVPLDVRPIAHESGYEVRIPVRGYEVRIDRERVVYDEMRVRIRSSVSRPRRFRRA